jgi:hypothetical protein
MEMAQEKKPVKGQEFLQRVGRSLIGNQNPNQSPEDTAAEYDKRTKAVEAQDQYLTTVDRVKNPPSVVEMQKEQTQRMADEKKAAEDRAKKLEDEQRERVEREAEEAKRQAEAAEQARKEAEDALKAQQNQILLEKLEELKGSRKPIGEQFKEYFDFAADLAEKMGFQRPGTAQPQSENPQIALEIAKINAESAQRDREFQLKLRDSDREWDLKLMEAKDKKEIEQAKLAQQAERDRALMNAPQLIGAALAQGLLDKGGGAPEQVIQSHKEKPVKITAAPGDHGEMECPFCHTMMAIGPTSVITKCVGCDREYPIERVPAEEPIPSEEK